MQNEACLNLATAKTPKSVRYENSITLKKYLPGSLCEPGPLHHQKLLQGFRLV
jgi:hypothetical protein